MTKMDINTYIAPQLTPLVVVADDDTTSSLMLTKVLSKDGYRVQSFQDGQSVLAHCCTTLPDIVLMDAIMPGLDGFECTKALKAEYGDNCPPILMITGLNDSESVNYAFEVGATDYVTKPFQWAVLRQRVRRAIKAHIDYKNLQEALHKERSLRHQLRSTNQKLKYLATTDSLTNIANRRLFDERLHHEWKRLQREKAPLGLALFDIDHFKAYNDTYGHQEGDDCLRNVAQIIQQVARRPADLAARYGGEEFALILPNTDLDGTIYLANLVRHHLQDQAIHHAGSPVKPQLTTSVGLTSIIPPLNRSAYTLLQTVDQALYDAKKQGRDRVVAYSKLCQRVTSINTGINTGDSPVLLPGEDFRRYDEERAHP